VRYTGIACRRQGVGVVVLEITTKGSYPVEMYITLYIEFNDSFVTTPPLPIFNFFTNPAAIAP
jgi:hypothetical protein